MDGKQEPEVASKAAIGVAVTEMVRDLADARAGYRGAEMIDQLPKLENLKSAASALQARLAVAFDVRQRLDQAHAGVPAEQLGVGIAAQIALAAGITGQGRPASGFGEGARHRDAAYARRPGDRPAQ